MMGLFDNVVKQVSKTTDSVVKGVGKMGSDAAGAIAQTGNTIVKKTQDAFTKVEPNNLIKPYDAMKIVYCVMAADGKIDESELEEFSSIGKQIDPKFKDHKKELIAECKKIVTSAKKDDDYLDALAETVSDIIKESKKTDEGSILPRLLLWNLIVIAYAEGKFSKTERKIVRTVARRSKIDSSIIKDMENSIRTVQLIENEERILKKSKKTYSKADENLKELKHRKKVIMESTYALINEGEF
jgi:uncharacterized tellurite resistance protein B-like protein